MLDSQNQRKSRSGGWKGGWRDRHDLSKAEEEAILLTRGNYENPEDKNEKTGEVGRAHYHTCQMHGFKLAPSGKGSYLSSRCALDAGQDDCLGCLQKETGDNRVTTKSTYSFNILHIALYEQVDLVRDGKVQRYDEDSENHRRGDPIQVWEVVKKPSDLRRIKESLDERLADGTVRMFRKQYLEVGAGHRDDLSEIDALAGAFCKCGGKVRPVAFICEDCEEELADVDKDDMTAEMIQEFAGKRARCEACGHVGLPMPESICDSCNDAQPLTAFDVVAFVRKSGEGTNTHIVIKDVKPLDEFTLPDGSYLIEWEKVGGQMQPKVGEDGNWVFTEDYDARKCCEGQWDFDMIHAPIDADTLATKLKVKNPFPPAPGSGKYRNYDARSRGRVDEGGEDKQPAGRRGQEEPPPREERRGRRVRR